MNNLRLPKTINRKLNGLKELGLDTNQKKAKIKEAKVE